MFKSIKRLTLLSCACLLAVSCEQQSLIYEDFTPNEQFLTQDEVSDDLVTFTTAVIPGKYIVVFKEDAMSAKRLDASLSYTKRQEEAKKIVTEKLFKKGISAKKVGHVYAKALKGFSAELSEVEVEKLKRDTEIDYIEKDQSIIINGGRGNGNGNGNGGGTPAQPEQIIPWGTTRVGGASGVGKRAWVIDTGVDYDHPDLNVNTALAETFMSGKDGKNADDGQGHGTHVAGTIAALDNEIGTVGVAPGAEIVPVKVLGSNGGSTSGVIAGVNYVAANAAADDVANMSLGGGASTSLDNAVIAASAVCKFVLAAGNEGANANTTSPARVNGANIFTVSAIDINDRYASFSNYGNPPIDCAAPGVSIKSTYKGSTYTSLSGTSMAAPHVAGLLLLGDLKTSGTASNDPDGNADPIAVY